MWSPFFKSCDGWVGWGKGHWKKVLTFQATASYFHCFLKRVLMHSCSWTMQRSLTNSKSTCKETQCSASVRWDSCTVGLGLDTCSPRGGGEVEQDVRWMSYSTGRIPTHTEKHLCIEVLFGSSFPVVPFCNFRWLSLSDFHIFVN